MAINKTTTQYFQNGSISFRAVSDTFGGAQPDGSIKFSTYKRDTESDEPLVPDATENEDISTDNDLSIEAFRDTIKEVVVTQTGTDEEVEFQSYFGANIAKNIKKRLEIDGTVFSDENNKYAAKITTSDNIRNLDLNVDGNIYGAGGPAGANGGGSLFIQSAGTNRKFNINLSSTAKIWAGGGGGSIGSPGGDKSGTCNQPYTVQRSQSSQQSRTSYSWIKNPDVAYWQPGWDWENTGGDVNDRVYETRNPQRQARAWVDAHCAPFSQGVQNFTTYNESDRRRGCRRRGGKRGRSRGQTCGNNWHFRCHYIYKGTNPPTIRFKTADPSGYWQGTTNYHTVYRNTPVPRNNSNTISANGGPGGSGGHGEGYFTGGTRGAQSGNPGNPGNSQSCPSGFNGGSVTGGAGNNGNKGGGWGEKGDGGSAGAFISYNGNVKITGKSVNTAKGREETR